MPPAGDFLCEQKVTKNSLRTYGSKNSSPDVYCQSHLTILLRLPLTLRGRVMVPLIPRFGALLYWVDDGTFVYRSAVSELLQCLQGFVNEEAKFFHKIWIFGETSGQEIAEALTNTRAAR